jgi:hypothetical protein
MRCSSCGHENRDGAKVCGGPVGRTADLRDRLARTRIGRRKVLKVVFVNGAEGRTRTADTYIFSVVLYQLSYLGTNGHSIDAPGTRASAP